MQLPSLLTAKATSSLGDDEMLMSSRYLAKLDPFCKLLLRRARESIIACDFSPVLTGFFFGLKSGFRAVMGGASVYIRLLSVCVVDIHGCVSLRLFAT